MNPNSNNAHQYDPSGFEQPTRKIVSPSDRKAEGIDSPDTPLESRVLHIYQQSAYAKLAAAIRGKSEEEAKKLVKAGLNQIILTALPRLSDPSGVILNLDCPTDDQLLRHVNVFVAALKKAGVNVDKGEELELEFLMNFKAELNRVRSLVTQAFSDIQQHQADHKRDQKSQSSGYKDPLQNNLNRLPEVGFGFVEDYLGKGGLGSVSTFRTPLGPVALKRPHRYYGSPNEVTTTNRGLPLKKLSEATMEGEGVLRYYGSLVERMYESVNPNEPAKDHFRRIDLYEVLRGADLYHLFNKETAQEQPDYALVLFLEMLKGVKALHDKNIIHTDLKVENYMLCLNENGLEVKLIDLDTAVKSGYEEKSGIVLGTPYFMSPEQISAKKLDARTDLFSLAKMLRTVLTNEVDKPYDINNKEETLDLLRRMMSTQFEFKVPNAVRQKLENSIGKNNTYQFIKILNACIRLNPNDRPSSVDELIEMLEGFFGSGESYQKLKDNALNYFYRGFSNEDVDQWADELDQNIGYDDSAKIPEGFIENETSKKRKIPKGLELERMAPDPLDSEKPNGRIKLEGLGLPRRPSASDPKKNPLSPLVRKGVKKEVLNSEPQVPSTLKLKKASQVNSSKVTVSPSYGPIHHVKAKPAQNQEVHSLEVSPNIKLDDSRAVVVDSSTSNENHTLEQSSPLMADFEKVDLPQSKADQDLPMADFEKVARTEGKNESRVGFLSRLKTQVSKARSSLSSILSFNKNLLPVALFAKAELPRVGDFAQLGQSGKGLAYGDIQLLEDSVDWNRLIEVSNKQSELKGGSAKKIAEKSVLSFWKDKFKPHRQKKAALKALIANKLHKL